MPMFNPIQLHISKAESMLTEHLRFKITKGRCSWVSMVLTLERQTSQLELHDLHTEEKPKRLKYRFN